MQFVTGAAAALAGAVGSVGSAVAAKNYSYLTPVFTTSNLSVREGLGTNYALKAVADERTGGRVFEGPESNDGYTWWKVQFSGDSDSGPVTGWVAENWLSRATFACPITGMVTSTYWDTRDGGRPVPPRGRLLDGRRRVRSRGPRRYGRPLAVAQRLREDDPHRSRQRLETWYAHLAEYRASAGDQVSRGDVVGIEGDSGIGSGHPSTSRCATRTATSAGRTTTTARTPSRGRASPARSSDLSAGAARPLCGFR
jgi:uncharacterized protein YraI